MNEYYFEPIKHKADSDLNPHTNKKVGEEIEIIRKELMHGVVDEVTFPANREWMSLRFTRKLENTAYFEVEIQSMSSLMSIGFIHEKEY